MKNIESTPNDKDKDKDKVEEIARGNDTVQDSLELRGRNMPGIEPEFETGYYFRH